MNYGLSKQQEAVTNVPLLLANVHNLGSKRLQLLTE